MLKVFNNKRKESKNWLFNVFITSHSDEVPSNVAKYCYQTNIQTKDQKQECAVTPGDAF